MKTLFFTSNRTSRRFLFVAAICLIPAAGFVVWRTTETTPVAQTFTAQTSIDTTRFVSDNAPVIASFVAPTATVSEKAARQLSYKIVGTFAHDTRAFTEGLLWHDGVFYESLGLPNRSEVRRVAFPSGRVLDSRKNAASVFGEGLALANRELVQLSWQNGIAFRYDARTSKPVGQFAYEGEGWGLTFNGDFVMSDGSDEITFRDAKTFAPKRTIRITFDGQPLTQLNELEWIDGKIWANVWRTDRIVQIDPRDGRVVSFLDLSGLYARDARNNGEDVLNGIAYDAKNRRLFVTGKLWPNIFQIELQPCAKM